MNKENQLSVFVLTEDTNGIWNSLSGKLPISDKTPKSTKTYLDTTSSLLSTALPPEVSVQTFSEQEIETALVEYTTNFLDSNPNCICICIDRFLLEELTKDPNYSNRLFRLQLCRNTDGQRGPRPNTPTLETQIKNLASSFPNIENMNILLVDNGVFSGGTIKFVIDNLSQLNIKPQQISVLGFIGDGQVEDLQRVGLLNMTIINEIPNLYDWVDLRDFGVFGGKLMAKNNLLELASAIPYLFPWSYGEGASLNKSGNLFKFSIASITSFRELIEEFESSLGINLSFQDLLQAGFALPTDKDNNILAKSDSNVVDYLDTCLNIVKEEQKRQVVILDMDGTLYTLDGQNGQFAGSSLEKQVNQNALKFIQDREQCSVYQAQEIMALGLLDKIGLSAYLAKRYNITRSQYFDVVWDINPEGILKNFETQVEIINQLKSTPTKLVLLTSAPAVWQKNVIKYLGLEDVFEQIFTAADFGTKAEIFEIFSQRYSPTNVTSVGDQEKTDILPATSLGLKGLLVKKPEDFIQLLAQTP